MRPSTYNDVTTKDRLVEDRDYVRVIFVGGNLFYLYVEGVDEPEKVRGVQKAYDRAETIRASLIPGYVSPDLSGGEESKGDSEPQGTAKPDVEAPTVEAGKTAVKPASSRYQLGDVRGTIAYLTPDDVLDLLADQAGRVALLQGESDTMRLAKRVGATDGRCAPIFLTIADDPEATPKMFGGLHTLACAINLDLKRVAVVTLPAEQATGVQSMVAALHYASLSRVGTEQEDEMIFRAHTDDD